MDPSENVLGNFSKGPFDDFKRGDTPEEGVVEEILGALGSLRRNQWIVEIGYGDRPKFASFATEHEFNILLVHRDAEPSDVRGIHAARDLDSCVFPADPAVVSFFDDAYDTWKNATTRPLVVVARIDPSVPPGVSGPTTFTGMVELGATKGYVPVCHADGLVFVRDDVVKRLSIPTVNFRNPERLFEYIT
jgi:hypothetical protein